MNRVNYNGARATDSTDFGLIGMEQTDPSDRGTAIDHIGAVNAECPLEQPIDLPRMNSCHESCRQH